MPTATPFNNLITFSRGSNATVTGSNGLIQWAPSNFLTFSEQFDNAAWSKIATTVTANTSVAPDGTATADTLVGDGTSAAHQVRLSVVASGAFQHVLSVYLKQGTERYGYLYTLGRNATDDKSDFCFFDLQTGTITQTNASGAGATISAVGNGWYRVTMPTGNYPSSINIEARIGITNTLNQQTSTASGNFLVWGAQLELGSTATTYNPTTVKNLLSFSEAFSDASWTKVAASIVTGAQANPINGLFNAQKFMEGTANAQYAVFRSVAVGAAPHTLSMYAKLAPGTPRFFCLYPQGAGTAWAIFDLALGTTTAVSAINYISSSITPVGSGWYRCSITLNTTASNLFCNAYLTNSSGTPAPSYTGDGNSGVYIYGAQLSDSASLDPYVPTPGAAPSSTAFYGPRFDFDPVTLQPRGLLVEEQRTNIILQSGNISSASWESSNQGTALAPTVTGNAGTAPDGTTTATRLQLSLGGGTATGDIVRRRQIITFTAVSYTFSVWIRSTDGSSSFNIHLQDPGGSTQNITVTGSWTRYIVSGVGPTGTGYVSVGLRGGQTPANNNTADILVWGGQLEIGSFATSYIPTVASTVTRSADVATVTGQNFAQWYAAAAGTITFSGTILGSPGAATVDFAQLSNGASNSIAIDVGMFDISAPLFQVINGSTQASIDLGSITVGGSINIAGAYKTDDFAGSLNGAAAIADTSGSVPTGIVQLGIGNRLGGVYMNGHIRNIRFIPARAADFQLQGLST